MDETVSLEVAIEVVLRNGPTFETIAGLCKMAVEASQKSSDEPVALRETLNRFLADKGVYLSRESIDDFMQRLNTRPQPAAWVGLTDEEVEALASWWPSYDQMPALKVLIKDVTNSLKEKNT